MHHAQANPLESPLPREASEAAVKAALGAAATKAKQMADAEEREVYQQVSHECN